MQYAADLIPYNSAEYWQGWNQYNHFTGEGKYNFNVSSISYIITFQLAYTSQNCQTM